MMTFPTRRDRSPGRVVPERNPFSGPARGPRLAAPDFPSRAPQAGPLNGGTIDSTEIALRDGELWVAHHDPSRALVIRCLAGYVWITQEGRAEDTVLGPGGLCVVAGEGKAVVQALEDAIIRVAH